MQISSNLLYDRSAARMSALMASANKLQTQIATGKKYSSPSENVAVAQQIAEFNRKDADAAAFGTNLDVAASLLQQADGTLASITDQMQQATELVNRAASDTLGASDRKVLGDQLKSVIATLVSLGNTNDLRGQPLFGSASGQPAVIDNKDGTFTYNTAASLSEIPIGENGLSIQPTETSARIFTSSKGDTLAMLSALATAMQNGEPTGEKARDAIDSLKTASDQVSVVQASVGARAARVDLQQNLLSNAKTDRAELRKTVEDADVTEVYTELSKTMTILSATQASFSKLSQLSLFTYLR
ncbi:flagellin [Sphingomonas sp. DT-51]|uniref:flagellin N-terminal helical domain-containing protein n=1 Tax=Sphingomonas sp. DT-51 TaxID=3396165 RepID=UPI003F1AD6F1